METEKIIGGTFLVFLIAGFAIAGCTKETFTEEEVKFQTLVQNALSNVNVPSQFIIRNIGELTDLRKKAVGQIVPDVDFNKEMVIAVFHGSENNGGFGIEVQKIVDERQNLRIFVQETYPGEDCKVTDSLTQPYHAVRIPKTDKEIKFETRKIVRECQPLMTVCTKEAKVCPDGSTVGRGGPDCAFDPCPPERSGETGMPNIINFSELAKGAYGRRESSGTYAIKSKEEWNNRVGIEMPPGIDFANEMAIAVFQGLKMTGGYSIEVKRIFDESSRVKVFVEQRSPGRGCMVTQALSQPYHIVSIPKTEKEVVFEIEDKVSEC